MYHLIRKISISWNVSSYPFKVSQESRVHQNQNYSTHLNASNCLFLSWSLILILQYYFNSNRSILHVLKTHYVTLPTRCNFKISILARDQLQTIAYSSKRKLLNNIMILTALFNILQKQVADLTKYSNIIVFICIEEKQQLTKKVRISAKVVPDSVADNQRAWQWKGYDVSLRLGNGTSLSSHNAPQK